MAPAISNLCFQMARGGGGLCWEARTQHGQCPTPRAKTSKSTHSLGGATALCWKTQESVSKRIISNPSLQRVIELKSRPKSFK